MPPVVSEAWRTSLVPATSVPVPPSTAVAPRRVPTGRGGSCALLTAGHTHRPPKTATTAAVKAKRDEFLWRIVTSLFSVSGCLKRFMFLPDVRKNPVTLSAQGSLRRGPVQQIGRALLQELRHQVSQL